MASRSSGSSSSARRKVQGGHRRRIGKAQTGLSDRMAKAIQTHLEDGEIYEALQAYKTSISRIQQGTDEELRTKVVPLLCEVASKAVSDFLGKEDLACVKDIAGVVLDHFNRCHVKVTDESLKALLGVNIAFESHDATPERAALRLDILRQSLAWSIKEGTRKHGHPSLHLALARISASLGSEGILEALDHYALAETPVEAARLIHKTSGDKAGSGVISENTSKLILSVTLKLLSYENIRDATVFFQACMGLLLDLIEDETDDGGLEVDEDTLEMILPRQKTKCVLAGYILEAVLRDAGPLYKLLCQKYASQLSQLSFDPNVHRNLDTIGVVYFGLPTQFAPAANPMSTMLNMLTQ